MLRKRSAMTVLVNRNCYIQNCKYDQNWRAERQRKENGSDQITGRLDSWSTSWILHYAALSISSLIVHT